MGLTRNIEMVLVHKNRSIEEVEYCQAVGGGSFLDHLQLKGTIIKKNFKEELEIQINYIDLSNQKFLYIFPLEFTSNQITPSGKPKTIPI